jgi:hypothetical protein
VREKNADDPICNFPNSLFIMTGLFLRKRSIILNISIKAITKPNLGETTMNIKFFQLLEKRSLLFLLPLVRRQLIHQLEHDYSMTEDQSTTKLNFSCQVSVNHITGLYCLLKYKSELLEIFLRKTCHRGSKVLINEQKSTF